jgi:hypothetical protein
MNEKGFSIFDLIITLAIIGFIITTGLEFLTDEEVGKKVGALVSDFNGEVEPKVVTKTVTIDNSGVNCLDGKKTITISGETYHLGRIKNTWGDLESVDCQ